VKRGTLVAVLIAILSVGPAFAQGALEVCLDFFVNPNHVPLVVAQELGFFADEGIDVVLRVPVDPSDPVKLAAVGTIDVALTPQINYLIARSEGLPLIAIGALIDRGLGGLLALGDGGIDSIDDLRGARIGYSLTPLEPILWRTMLDCAGIVEDEVQLIHVGYATMQSLLGGSVDAVGAFRNFEPFVAELEGGDPIFFPQEDYCIPETYELVFVVNTDLIAERGDDLAAFLRGVARGIEATVSDPDTAFTTFLAAHPDLDDELNRRSFDATLPLYADGARHDNPVIWAGMTDYLSENGLIAERLPLEELFTDALLPAGPQPGE
jgi:putative hydroxymethylpyrimidine transport system substrate-binding protein